MRYHTVTLAPLLALLHFGCSSSVNPAQKCNSLVSALCKKTFDCGGSAAFPSEADCESQLSTKIGCANWTLPEGCTYDWSQFDTCLSDVSAEPCSMAQSGQQPASCAGATAIQPTCSNPGPGSGIYCSDESSNGSNSSCTATHSGCTDGNAYAMTCDSSGCLCKVNGMTTQPATATSCTNDEATLNQLCGWNLHVFPKQDMAHPPPLDLAPPPDLTAGCTVSGTFYPPGIVNPNNPCEICDTTRSSSGWSAHDNVSCGNGCGLCAAHLCGPVVLSTTASGMAQAMAIDADYVYWTDRNRGTVSKVPLAGGQTITLASGQYQAIGIAVDASYVYWSTIGSGSVGTIQKMPLAGGTATTLGSAGKFPAFLTIDAASVYWTDVSIGAVLKVPLGGGTVTTLASGQSTPRGIVVDATSVYWVNNGDGTVMKVPIAGGTATQLASGQQLPFSMAIDSTYVYWNTYREVMRMPRAGGAITSLNPSEGQIAEWGLAVDGTSAYWANAIMNGSVGKVLLAGGNVITVAAGQAQVTPYAVAVGSTCSYFTADGSVARAPK